MIERLKEWLGYKWRPMAPNNMSLMESYRVTFATVHGQLVLQHLMDTVYCTVYEGSDSVGMAHHGGRRSLVHDILLNMDAAEHPSKYFVPEGGS